MTLFSTQLNMNGEEIEKNNSSRIKQRMNNICCHLLPTTITITITKHHPTATGNNSTTLVVGRQPSIGISMASEKHAALTSLPSHSPTIFDKIINKEIPAKVVYEDDKVLAFRDIAPQAPTHILIIPKVRDGLTGLSQAEEKHCEILGRLMYVAKLVAKQEGLDDGFRVVINDGPSGCQSVYHIHVHLLGGRQMNWPPG